MPHPMNVFQVLEAAPPAQPGRPRPAVKRLLQGDGVNLITFTFSPGHALPDHQAAHPIMVQCLSGILDFSCEGETVRLGPGTVVHLPDHVMHRVDCPEDSPGEAVLLLSMLTGERHP